MAIITAHWITGLLITNGLNRLFEEKRDIEAYIVVLIGLRSDLAYKWFHRLAAICSIGAVPIRKLV